MQIKYHSWEDVPIRVYKELVAANAEGDSMSRNVATIAILCDTTEEEVWNLSLPQIGALTSQLQWIKDFDFRKDFKKVRGVKAGKFDCALTDNMADFSVAQYVDFNALWSAPERDMAMLLTTFLVPRGHRYNEGYDILELRDAFEEGVSIAMANSLCFFFLKSLLISMRVTLIYWDYIAERMGKRMTPEAREEMERLRRRIECFYGSLS